MSKGSGGTRGSSWRDKITGRANLIGDYETDRYKIKEKAYETRSFFEAYRKPNGDFFDDFLWPETKEAASLTVEKLSDGTIYLNRLDAWKKNSGVGRELLTTVLQRYKKQGVKEANCYVEWMNGSPLSLIRSLGFKETGKETDGGRYFKLKLKDLKVK